MSREDVLSVLTIFCEAFTRRDPKAVLRLFAPDADVAVVTSEEPLLRGHDELRRFVETYVRGPTTYSWEWERSEVSLAGPVAWLLAEGTETATSREGQERHPYRMTMVCENRNGRWLLRQVHGSSPHSQ